VKLSFLVQPALRQWLTGWLVVLIEAKNASAAVTSPMGRGSEGLD